MSQQTKENAVSEIPLHIQKILEERYYALDRNGEFLETKPEQLYRRVAWHIATAGRLYGESENDIGIFSDIMFELMNKGIFLPNTPTLVNAGKENPGSFSACFVLPVKDSMTGIFDAVKNGALIHKSGGGTGYNFGKLREEGAIVGTTGHPSSGPISFMSVFNSATETIKQGGVRRGANIGILPVSHPNIIQFITAKDKPGVLENFNISVSITDKFMRAVENDDVWDLVSPHTDAIVDTVRALDVWNLLVEHAWESGEPGIIFIDTINAKHPFSSDKYKIEAVNPCGELPLRDYESCNLGSINLASFYDDVSAFDFDLFKAVIHKCVKFLDNVIDLNPYPIPEIQEATLETRKIGLGVMGWAELLLLNHIPYNSNKALVLAENIATVLEQESAKASMQLAMERGNFPAWGDSKYAPNDIIMRNATRTCIAPAGSISRIANTSSGIEPYFSFKTHHNLEIVKYDETHWAYYDYLNEEPWAVTSKEISADWHLSHQTVWQKHIDSAVSKTINLPESASKEDVSDIFMKAWKQQIKGLTIYRNMSRSNQPLQESTVREQTKGFVEPNILVENEDQVEESMPQIERRTTRNRGKVTFGPTHKVDTGNGKIYITVNYSNEEEDPVEVFIRLGHKSTSVENELAEWCGRLISIMLKYNIPIEAITRQGRKVYGEGVFWYNQKPFKSLPQLISHLLGFNVYDALNSTDFELTLEDEDEPCVGFEFDNIQVEKLNLTEAIELQYEHCYQCGEKALIRESGCAYCTNCGYDKCG